MNASQTVSGPVQRSRSTLKQGEHIGGSSYWFGDHDDPRTRTRRAFCWRPLDNHRWLGGTAGLLAQFKSDGPPGFLLPDRCTIRRIPAGGDILDPNDAVDHETVGHHLKARYRDGIAKHVLRPGHSRGWHGDVARNQAKITALARTEHQAVRRPRGSAGNRDNAFSPRMARFSAGVKPARRTVATGSRSAGGNE